MPLDETRGVPPALVKAMIPVYGRDAVKGSVRVVLAAERGRPRKSGYDDAMRMWRAGLLEDDGMTPWAAMMAVLDADGVTDARERKQIFLRINARTKRLAKAPIVGLRDSDADEVERWAKLIEAGPRPSY